MKKIYLLYFAICIYVFFTGCNDKNIDKPLEDSTSIQYAEYTNGDIYMSGKYSDLSDPVTDRLKLYPAAGGTYSLWSEKCIYIDAETLDSYPICQDPLCSHSAIPCISYSAIYTNKVFEIDSTLYFLTHGDDMSGMKFIAYNLVSGDIESIAEYEYGGAMLANLGRFIYFYSMRDDGELESGQTLMTKLMHRYDVETNELVLLSEAASSTEYLFMTGYDGYIYYLNNQMQLVSCDANMRNMETLIPSGRVKTYTIIGNEIYYLTKDVNNENYGNLYVLDILSEELNLLYENVTWFCCADEKLYYSLYTPVSGFEWDFPYYNENDEQKMSRVAITVNNGNKVYEIAISDSDIGMGKKDGFVLKALTNMINSECFIGEVYAVRDGILYTQYKEQYIEGEHLGMTTGICGISLQTGEIYRFTSSHVMYS